MARKTATARKTKNDRPDLKPLNIKQDLGGGRYAVSLDQLGIGKTNMRHGHQPDKALIASLKHHGQLHDLIVKTPATTAPWLWEIVDGGRRYVSAVEGVRTGELPADFLFRVRVEEGASKEQSVAANLHMAAHPLDVCEAILELAKTAEDEQAIAAHFGQSVQWVQQRALLAQLSESAKTAYRDGRMDLKVAQLMTRLPEKEQDRLAKGKNRIDDWQVRQTIERRSIPADLALFDWEKEYPADKIQRGLFEDIGTMLLDPPLFMELQEKAVERKIRELTDEGYNVERLKPDDYTTLGKYVEFTGKPKDEEKASLHIFVKKVRGVEYRFTVPMISRKEAGKVKKGAKGKADRTDEAPKPKKATDITPAQVEILRGHVWQKLRLDVMTGKAPEALVQFTIIDKLLEVATGNNGPDSRWEKLKKDYPGEFDGVAPLDDRADMGKLGRAEGSDYEGYEEFARLSPAKRQAMVLKAVAACLQVPWGSDEKSLRHQAQVFGAVKVTPGEKFFRRYRVDQLLDFLKRHDVKEFGTTKKRGELAGLCVGRPFELVPRK
jgi:hypothetical protein